jgi:hypothetical protein
LNTYPGRPTLGHEFIEFMSEPEFDSTSYPCSEGRPRVTSRRGRSAPRRHFLVHLNDVDIKVFS